uniref:Uncharacterized protein n=1 Tax=Arcella intermedia TaxID=1963864 RepID=A0A6B2KX68_9EUKA
MIIGQPVIYRIEHHDPSSDRHYGELWDRKENDVRKLIVENGWADVITRERKNSQGVVLEPFPSQIVLETLLSEAKSGKRGMWSSGTKDAVRNVKYIEPFRDSRTETLNYEDLYELYKSRKDKKNHHAVVESVKTGSQLNLLLTDTMENVTVCLSGIRCPGTKSDSGPEMFHREAKFFTEYYLLHRTVSVTFDSIDKVNIYATVILNGDVNIAFDLLRMGLANVVEWSIPKGQSGLSERLKEEEKAAQAKNLRMWKSHQPVAGPDAGSKKGKEKSLKESSVVTGKVVEVVNSGTITVRVATSNKTVDRIISLSSIRPPRVYPKSFLEEEQDKDKLEDMRKETAFAAEAKEFLRNLLIGQKVRCVFDYGRNNRPQSETSEKNPPVVKLFWSVYYTENNKEKSVAVELVRQGLSKVQSHSDDEPRSVDYQELVVVEKEAIAQHKGVHGSVYKKANSRLNDLTPPPPVDDEDDTHKRKALTIKCRQFLPFLQKHAKIDAVVEYVFAASRYKMVIPSNSCVIMFSLQGMLVERPERKEVPGSAMKPDISAFDKQFPPTTPGNIALHFARDEVFQRKVQITVTNLDKFGNFMGVMFVNGKDFALSLLEQGHARIHTRATRNLPNFTAYKAKEDEAKKALAGLWATFDFAAEAEKKAKEIAQRNAARSQKPDFPVVITDFRTASTFSFQILNSETASLNELVSSLQNEKFNKQPSYLPKKGEIVAAQFTVDDRWYRAQVIGDNKPKNPKSTDEATEFEIRFIDYGNRETLGRDRIRVLPKEYIDLLPAQAYDGKLYGVVTPDLDKDFGQDSAVCFRELVWDKTLNAQEVLKETDFYHLILKDDKVNVNIEMVASGLAKAEKTNDDDAFIKQLNEAQDDAYNNRRGMWQYGYYPDSDEERDVEKSLLR